MNPKHKQEDLDERDEDELEDRDEDEEDEENGKGGDLDPDDEDSDEKGNKGKKGEKAEEDEVEIVKSDERLVGGERKGRDDENVEDKRARRRLEKKQKRERRLAAERRDKMLIQQLRRENQDLKKGQTEINQKIEHGMQRIASQDELQIDTAMAQQQNVYNAALTQFNKAVSEGNGSAAAEAQRYMNDASGKHTQLQNLKSNFVAERTKQQNERQTAKKPSNTNLALLRTRFITQNEWYDPNGGDEDSLRAKEIDEEITEEGYDPNTKDYWDELKYRIKQEGLGGAGDEDEEDKPRRRTNGANNGNGRASPRARQTAGSDGADGYSPGTKGKLRIPEHVVEMAKNAGQWDDPFKRKLFMKNWKEQNGVA